MGQFIAAEHDFLTFASLFAFVLCALECIVLNREERGRRWLSFFSFFLFQGLAAFWIMVSPIVPAGRWSALLVPFLQSLSFGSLFAFGPSLAAQVRQKLWMVIVAFGLIAGCAGAGVWFGPAPYSITMRLFLGIPGIALAARFLLSDPAIRIQRRPWLVAYACTFCALGVLLLLGTAGEMFFHGRFSVASIVPRVFVSFALAVTLSLHQWRSFARLNRGYGRPLTRLVIFGSFLALPLLLVFSGFVTPWLGQKAQDGLRGRYSAEVDGIRNQIEALTGEFDRAVSILSGAPSVALYFTRRGPASQVETAEHLNRYAYALKAACYLLDTRGKVVAFSVGAPDSFIRTSHAEASWFRDAVEGGTGRAFNVALSTIGRGYHASAPVWDLTEGIVGVALIVKEIGSDFMTGSVDQITFLINENGVIFYSTQPGLSYRVLWPLPRAIADAMISSRELGVISFSPVLDTKPADGELGFWNGSLFMASRSYLSIPGWSVVHLGPIAEVLLYRFAALWVSLVMALVIASFSAAGQMSLLDEARIERSESLYRALIEGSPDWISIVDTTGAFIFTNRAGRESLGIDGSGNASIEAVLGPEHVSELARGVEVAAQGSVLSFETVLASASGDAKVWRITLVPLPAGGQKRTAILIGSDVTDMRSAEARLVRAERMAALGTLAGGVAHQFNNINAVAMGYLQILESEPDLPQKVKTYLGSVREALERSVLITTRLLPLSAPHIAVEPMLLLEDTVRAILPSLQPDLDREKVTLELSFVDGLAVSINIEQLGFVVEALLVNAWQAVLEQPVRRIQVTTGTANGEVFLRVEDTGIGISPEKLSSIFTPFFTEKGEHAAPQSPQAHVKGVGLSLAVAHSIVAAREGRIEIESPPGAGARFTVWLPRGELSD
jgi:PAS domain S-box-containing protein